MSKKTMGKNKDKTEKYNSPVAAVLTGIGDLFKRPKNQLNLDNLPTLDGKRVLITGASSGLGYATAVDLASRGAHVIMAQRSGIPAKGEQVKRESGSEKVDMIQMDLSDLESLKNLTGEIKERFGLLDIVVCNAAMVANKSRTVKQGLDEMFVVNYFAKFILVNQVIKEGVLNQDGPSVPRIIFVASESHRNPSAYDWESFGSYEPYGIKQSVAMYGYYKLLLLTMANEFSRRINTKGKVSCSVFSLCPGPVNSNIAREAPALFQPLLKLVFGIFFRSPKKACRPVSYLAASSDMEGKTEKYMFLMQRKEMDEKATDPQNGKRLWELSEKLSKHILNQ
jgi:NAD(P)-dependent dehydrogenase (short-subunit alcohol dehydrogenase family)